MAGACSMDHVLYFVSTSDPTAIRGIEAALAGAAARASSPHAIRVSYETSAERTVARLRSGGGADALVIDARYERGPLDQSRCVALLRMLFDEHDVSGVVARARTWLIVSDDGRGAELAFEAGRARLAGILAAPADARGWDAIWGRIEAATARTRGGKIALCLAGGGPEGLFWELGVLRAVQRFLPMFSLAEVDIVCGISAGAILGGMLANGIGPDELSRGFKGERGRVMPIGRRDLFDPDLTAFARRAARLSFDVVRARRSPLSALFRWPPAGIFAGARLRRWLFEQLNQPGMIDRFDALPRQLFIGATDQDTSEHVVFGVPGAARMPIHRAIRASTALSPFYAPERIDGRYYVDGGFTRTTNMRVAVEHGATLVLLVDPLVPAVGDRPGHVVERGGVFAAMQGLKALVNGRFDKAVPTLRSMYPHVAFHLFQPGEGARRMMGGSPLRYFYREAMEELALRETTRELRTRRGELIARDFARHGIRFGDPDAVRPSMRSEPYDLQVVT